MRHAKINELKELEELLNKVKAIEGIKERTQNHFYYKGLGILHFHSDSGQIYADVGEERILIGTIGNMSKEAMDKTYNLVKKASDKRMI